MKVLKVGAKNQCTCTNCGSVLQFELADISLVHRPITVGPYEIETMPEPEDHYQGTVICPVCKKVNSVQTTRDMRRAHLNSMRSFDDL